MKLILSLLFSISAFTLEVPALTSPVLDLADILQGDREIESLIRQYYKKTGVQFQVLTLPSLKGETIEGYGIKVAEKWKLGGEKNDSGLIFLISVAERKTRIEVGYGLEPHITDLESSIILGEVSRFFKAGQFDKGTLYALQESSKLIGDPFLNKEIQSFGRDGDILFKIFIFLFILIMIFHIKSSRRNFRGRGNKYHYQKRRRRWDDDDFFGGGGFGGGSSGGGGFGGWSGGGGGFGGGGASGGW